MRFYAILFTEVEMVTSHPFRKEMDKHGNPRLTGFGRGDRAIIVVLAKDDPDFVITTFRDD